MCVNNPEYLHNIAVLKNYLSEWALPADAKVCDLGAGTGNYICELAPDMPSAKFVHLDANKEMNEIARQKYATQGWGNVEVVESMAQRVQFPEEHFDLILCIHSLYTMAPQQLILSKVSRWLKTDGYLFVIDLGRRQDVVDWGLYLFREMVKRHGLIQYVRRTLSGLEVARQNRITAKGQETGRYWLHSTQEFGETLRAANFDVQDLYSCYRGYSDLAVCRRSRS